MLYQCCKISRVSVLAIFLTIYDFYLQDLFSVSLSLTLRPLHPLFPLLHFLLHPLFLLFVPGRIPLNSRLPLFFAKSCPERSPGSLIRLIRIYSRDALCRQIFDCLLIANLLGVFKGGPWSQSGSPPAHVRFYLQLIIAQVIDR